MDSGAIFIVRALDGSPVAFTPVFRRVLVRIFAVTSRPMHLVLRRGFVAQLKEHSAVVAQGHACVEISDKKSTLAMVTEMPIKLRAEQQRRYAPNGIFCLTSGTWTDKSCHNLHPLLRTTNVVMSTQIPLGGGRG